MKKILILVLFILLIFTGCSTKNKSFDKDNNLVVCSVTYDEDGVKIISNINTTFKNNLIDKVSATMEFVDNDTMETYCEYFNMLNTNDEKLLDLDCSGNTITIKDYKKMVEVDKDTIDSIGVDEFISQMESNGYTCKK